MDSRHITPELRLMRKSSSFSFQAERRFADFSVEWSHSSLRITWGSSRSEQVAVFVDEDMLGSYPVRVGINGAVAICHGRGVDRLVSNIPLQVDGISECC